MPTFISRLRHGPLFALQPASQGRKEGLTMTANLFIVQGRVAQARLDASAAPLHRTLMNLLNRSGAAVLLLLFSPLMLIAAFLIWRRDGAPVFFGHYRVGRDGELFKCWKFRTMVRNSQQMLEQLLRDDPVACEEWARDQKLSNDPRVTGIGAFLRRTSLDELPQLFNVLRGEMALVGPRPITVPELERYG